MYEPTAQDERFLLHSVRRRAGPVVPPFQPFQMLRLETRRRVTPMFFLVRQLLGFVRSEGRIPGSFALNSGPRGQHFTMPFLPGG